MCMHPLRSLLSSFSLSLTPSLSLSLSLIRSRAASALASLTYMTDSSASDADEQAEWQAGLTASAARDVENTLCPSASRRGGHPYASRTHGQQRTTHCPDAAFPSPRCICAAAPLPFFAPSVYGRLFSQGHASGEPRSICMYTAAGS